MKFRTYWDNNLNIKNSYNNVSTLPDLVDHQRVIELIIDEGIDTVSALQQSSISFTTEVYNNEEYDTKINHDWGTGFYLTKGDREAFYSVNQYDRSFSELIELAEKLQSTDPEIDRETSYSGNERPIEIDITSEGPWTSDFDTELDEIIQYLVSLLKEGTGYKYRIVIEGELIKKKIETSYSAPIIQKYSNSLATIELFDKNGGNSIYVFDVLGGVDKANFSLDLMEHKVQTLKDKYSQLENADRLKQDTYPVILSPDTSYSLIHESIGHGVEADQVLSGDSFLWNKIGQKVGASNLTITDDPHIRGSGWSEFDDEGTKTKGTILVDEGILVDFLHTRRTAKLFNSIPTGNARATSYLSPPEPRQSNIYVEPRDYSEEELLEFVGDGIYLGPTISASTSIYSGEYVIETQYAYRIENGELGQILGPVTMNGYSLQTLSDIQAIGNEITKGTTLCVKDDSRLTIGALSPKIALSPQLLT